MQTCPLVAVLLFLAHIAHIRPLDPIARGALEIGGERSTLFRALVGAVDRSDLIVYIQTAAGISRPMDGRLQFAAAVEGARYLRITLRRELPPDRLAALLGHELMPAVEVAREPHVRDAASVRALYTRIGHSDDGVAFDTSAAVAAGHQVLGELRVSVIPAVRGARTK